MRKLKIALLVLFSFMFTPAAFAVHCWNAPQIQDAAHRLEREARHFQRVIRNMTGYSHIADDAARLARAARHLHDVAHRGYSCHHIRRDFAKVRRNYRHVLQSLEHAHRIHHSVHIKDDWHALERAYRVASSEVYSGVERDPDRDLDSALLGALDRLLDELQ